MGHFEIHTRVLRDGEVSHGALNEALEEFLFLASEEDTIVVFVAGHGARSKAGTYYFLPPDASPARPARGIPRDEIYKLVHWDALRARQRLLLMDTCHAGEDFGDGARGVRLSTRVFDQGEVDAALRDGNGVYIVAASTELGEAREVAGNGVFTRGVLDGLRGEADTAYGRGTVDVRELVRYVEGEVLRMTNGAQLPTVPSQRGGQAFPLSKVTR